VLIRARARRPHSLRLPPQPRKAIPRLGDHDPQLLVLLLPNGEPQHHRFELVMKTARRPAQLIDLPMQAVDGPSQNEERY
jgi:hypothetical protein